MHPTDTEKSSKADYLKHCGTITKGKDNNKKKKGSLLKTVYQPRQASSSWYQNMPLRTLSIFVYQIWQE